MTAFLSEAIASQQEQPVSALSNTTLPFTQPPQRAYPLDDYLNLPREADTWLIKPLIPAGGNVNLYGSSKVGKALALDTPIPTPNGWTTMAALQPGDLVFGVNGLSTLVTGVSDVHENRICLKITFLDQTSIVVDADHMWEATKKGKGCIHCNPPKVVTTAEMAKCVTTKPRKNTYSHYNWHIRLSAPQQFLNPARSFPLAPYLLGLWLGDGTQSNSQYTSADPELVDAWKEGDWDIRKQASNDYGYGVQGLAATLREMAVLNNKHIPEMYMTASVEDRIALLQGLMDTDGWCKGGTGTFYNMNEHLVAQITELARGLGCKATRHTKRAMLRGKDCGLCHFVGIRSSFNIFKLKRKASKFILNTETYLSISSIEPVESVPVKCITVDATDHLFLAGINCLPTHNSFSAIQLAAALTGTMPDWLGFSVTGVGPTLYVQLDTPRSLWMARLDEIRAAGFDLTKIHFADRETLDTWPFNIMLDDHFGRLRREVERIAPVAVILDTIRETHSGDENDSGAMKDVVARLEAVVRPAALILISHARKPSHESGPDLISDARGSSYVAGRMDAIIKFTPKHMIYTGRAVEEGTIKLARLECGLWTPAQGEIDTHVAAVLADSTLTTISAKAKVLSQRIVKSEEACRSLLRRAGPRTAAQPS